jgi:hypothetical protein
MTFITLNLIRDSLEEDRVIAYKATSMSMDLLISWSQDIVSVLERSTKGGVCRILYDLSHPGVSMQFLVLTNREVYKPGFTHLGFTKVQQILERNPQFSIKLAIVLSPTGSGELASKYVKSADHPGIKHKLFFNRERALEWLTTHENSTHEATNPTKQIGEDHPHRILTHNAEETPQTFNERREIALLVDDSLETLHLEADLSVTLGRATLSLEGYGTRANTVSRKHARLYIDNDYLYITDLNSTNGTYINGERLEPMKPYLLKRDDHLNLGALSVQVIFR